MRIIFQKPLTHYFKLTAKNVIVRRETIKQCLEIAHQAKIVHNLMGQVHF